MNRIILSCQSAFFQYALDELTKADITANIDKKIDTETFLFYSSLPFTQLAYALKNSVFIRHICPADIKVSAISIENIINAAVKAFAPTEEFSVQTRIMGNSELKPFDINKSLSDTYVSAGCQLNVREPKQIISIVISDNAYIGISSVQDNLSSWAGGRIRFQKSSDQISRAEFKLEEAISCMGLEIKPEYNVLDLGAAPGGWSRISLKMGANVTAVDPAALDERIFQYPNITHIRDVAQNYLKNPDGNFDLILNDMKMDAQDSASLTNLCCPVLKDNGRALITLKLSAFRPDRQIYTAQKILSKHYSILKAKQLFHNRSEITLLLAKADNHS